MTARRRLLKIVQRTVGDNARGKVGPGHAPALVGDLNRLAGDLELPAEAHRSLQALGQRLRERGRVRRFDYIGRRIDVQSDSQVQGGDRHGFGAFRGVEQALALSQLYVGPQTFLFFQRAALFQLPGHVEVVVGAADGILCSLSQGPRAKHLVVGYGHLIRHGLIRTLRL